MSKDELSPVRYSGDATNIDDDDQSGTDDDNATNAKVVTNRDLFLYFFLGATTKLIQGLSLTPTFIKAVHVTGPQMPQTGLAFSIGAVLGMVIVATVYPKLRPKIRIFFSGSLQFIGVIILALPVPPVNWWLGLIVLAMGVGSMVGTILPLTSYAVAQATKAFQIGFALSNLLGALTSKLFELKWPRLVYVFIILCFPVLNVGCFVSLDQSPWDHIGKSASDPTKDEDHDDEGEDGLIEVAASNGNEGEELSIDSDDNDNKKDQEGLMSKNELGFNSDTGVVVDDNDDNDENNDDSKNQGPLSKHEMKCAVMQMLYRYWPIWLIAGIAQQLLQLTLLYAFESSSFTYGGMEPEKVPNQGSTLTIITFTCAFLFGLTVMTKLGRIISTMNPFLLWIPVSIMIVLICTAFIGVVYGVFPPMIYGPYFFYPIIFVSYQCIQIYSPLIIRNDEKLNSRFAEIQMQTLYLVNYLAVFSVTIFGVIFLQVYILDSCSNNYGKLSNILDDGAVSCTAMLD